MARLALLSKHIVLTEYNNRTFSYPVSGVILIEDGLIKQVDLIENYNANLLTEKYIDWNPIDYTSYYISPGIIDLNTRVEWETYEQITKESLKGGVTCAVIEPSYYQPSQAIQSLYCDVCLSTVLDESLKNLPPESFILKAYLFPPAPSIKSISNIDYILKLANKNNSVLMIDPTMPDPRMLYMASPHRLEVVEERSKQETTAGSSSFAAAFPESMKNSSSSSQSIESGEEDDESEELVIVKKSISLEKNNSLLLLNNHHNRSASIEKNEKRKGAIFIIEEETDVKKHCGNRKSSHDIFQELDDRIKEREKNIEDLCRAESITYNYSGNTNFLSIEIPKKSSSMTSLSFSLDSPDNSLKSPEPARRKFRPSPIQVNTTKPDVSKDYTYYLANCPEYWETAGIEKVLEYAKQDYFIHFTGISSASGINILRHVKKKFPNITCDISAGHLCFTSASVKVGDTRFKSAPPIRNQGNCNLLWDLLKMKGIDCITSGHSFIKPSLKLTENFLQSISGIPAAGLSLFSVWNTLNIPVSKKEQLEHYIVRLAKWLSLNPGKVLKLNDRGKIDIGKRADLIIWEPSIKHLLESDYVYRETSPYLTQELMGKILRVYMKGELAYDGEIRQALGSVVSRNN